MDKVSFGFIKSVHLSMDHKVCGVIKSMSVVLVSQDSLI